MKNISFDHNIYNRKNFKARQKKKGKSKIIKYAL